MSRRARIRRAYPRGSSGAGRRNWPTWDPETSTSRLQGGGGAQGFTWDAVGGGWVAGVFWLGTTAPSPDTVCGYNDAGGSQGWRITISATRIMQLRVRNAVGGEVVQSLHGAALAQNRFHAFFAVLDILGGTFGGAVDNGAEQSGAVVGFSPCGAGDRMGVAGRPDAASGGMRCGGVHALAGATGGPLTAGEKVAFWAQARTLGLGSFGDGGEAFNPTAQSKWVAHTLADERPAANTLAKSGTVNDRAHPPVLAW